MSEHFLQQRHGPAFKTSQSVDSEKQKRLGQYFTGVGLGRLLAALAQAESAKSILDPMAGSGDLLASCLEVGSRPSMMAGIEIDPAAHEACTVRLLGAQCILGNAFAPSTIKRLPATSWDLVIANPPYVRYQSFAEKDATLRALPSAAEIRADLLKTLEQLHALDDEDKRLFAQLVNGYSGMSDLAVPSWILCAALVKEGGRLALVVPESWLSRDYATIVHYLLLRWFEVEFVVEDEHALWFENVQVKTTLIIAKRVKRRISALSQQDSLHYSHILISASAADQYSPIGRIMPDEKNIERSFAKKARYWLNSESNHATECIQVRQVSVKHECRNMLAVASRQKWFVGLNEISVAPTNHVYIPHEIYDWLVGLTIEPFFENFETQGIAVGQGLRTGANSFFYATGEQVGETVELSFSGPLTGLTAKAPLSIARAALRRQSDLPEGFVVSPKSTKGWLLDFRRHALPQDIEGNNWSPTQYQPMPDELAKVVIAAAQTNFGKPEKPMCVWDFTAVSTNIRPASRGAPARHWYMLPNFTLRHSPDVLLARVNQLTPKAYLNKDRACLVDANFSSIWIVETSQWTAAALLAFMNATWAQAVIEHSGAVMGGGALKVEAAHLRRLPVPAFDKGQLQTLSALGNRLAKGEGVKRIIGAIDRVVEKVLGCDEKGTKELQQMINVKQMRRSKHKGK